MPQLLHYFDDTGLSTTTSIDLSVSPYYPGIKGWLLITYWIGVMTPDPLSGMNFIISCEDPAGALSDQATSNPTSYNILSSSAGSTGGHVMVAYGGTGPFTLDINVLGGAPVYDYHIKVFDQESFWA